MLIELNITKLVTISKLQGLEELPNVDQFHFAISPVKLCLKCLLAG